LGAIFIGPRKYKPSAKLMLKSAISELRTLGNDKICWIDDQGKHHYSSVFLTMVQSDSPQMAELMNLLGHGGSQCCPFCKYEGSNVGPKTNPAIYTRDNEFRKTISKKPKPVMRY
jgi:hypothetical protein